MKQHSHADTIRLIAERPNYAGPDDIPEPNRPIASAGEGRSFNWWYTDVPKHKHPALESLKRGK